VFALGFGFAAIDAIVKIAQKFLAGFRMNCAAIETVRGTARNVHLSKDRRTAHFDVDAQQIELEMPRTIVIADGDEVAVAGQRAGDGLLGIDYSNVTRHVTGRSWMTFGPPGALLWIGAVSAGAIGLWVGGDDTAIITLFRRVLAFAFMTGVLIYGFDRYFRWRLDLEAGRRVRSAGYD
jgi:hypothetical protein